MSVNNKQIRSLVHKIQKDYDCDEYEEKDKNDKLVCQLCKGRYIRQKKSTHLRTNKHINKIKQLKKAIEEIFN